MKRKATVRPLAFAKVKAGLEHAIAYHRGARQLTVRDVESRPPAPMGAKDLLAVRTRLRLSQAAFARILNVSPRTVQGLGHERAASLRGGAEAPLGHQEAPGGPARMIRRMAVAILSSCLLSGACLPADREYLIRTRVYDRGEPSGRRVVPGVSLMVKYNSKAQFKGIDWGATGADGRIVVAMASPPRDEGDTVLEFTKAGFAPIRLSLSTIVAGIQTACLTARPCQGMRSCWDVDLEMALSERPGQQ